MPRGLEVKNVKLGKWVGTQRSAYRSERLRADGEQPPKNSPRINAVQIAKLEVREGRRGGGGGGRRNGWR